MFLFRGAESSYQLGTAFLLGIFAPPIIVGYYSGAERIVKNCQYLGTVQGSVDVGNTLLFFSQIRCKNRAKRNAALLGATHIVWLHVHKTSAVAMAYKCEIKE